MKNNKYSSIEIDENISYFIGVLHSDGIYLFEDKIRRRMQIRFSLGIGEKSKEMGMKVKEILSIYFNRKTNLRKIPNKKLYSIQTSINRLYSIFSK